MNTEQAMDVYEARQTRGPAVRTEVDIYTAFAASGPVRRGTRLPLRVPVAFRTTRHDPWMFGWTVNVSRSGVLLECASGEALPAHGLEFVIGLSRGVPGASDVHCHGRVVRIDSTAEGSRVALTIDDFQCEDAGPPAAAASVVSD